MIQADLSQQAPNNSYDPPLFYVDKPFICCDCGKEEVWTAEDQKWWYEVCKGPIQSVAKRCLECRRQRRDQHAGSPRISTSERWERKQQEKLDTSSNDSKLE